jgi:hypothetical protein
MLTPIHHSQIRLHGFYNCSTIKYNCRVVPLNSLFAFQCVNIGNLEYLKTEFF